MMRRSFGKIGKRFVFRRFVLSYVTDRRMEDAKSLLKETDLPVKEIAKEVGYSDVNTFIRRFKAKTGSTPTEFRTF